MLCIPQQLSKKLLAGAKAGEFNVLQLTEMTSKQRNELFSKYVDKGTSQSINALFEKALISEQKTALKKWAESVFGTKPKDAKKYKNVLAKIERLDELGVLNPSDSDSFFQDLVADQLGVSISAEEAKNISERAEKLEELSLDKEQAEALMASDKEMTPEKRARLEEIAKNYEPDEFGLPKLEYLKARKDMYDYLNSIAPSPRLKILTSTIARGNMLFSIKSPTTNIIGNTVMGIQQALERRLSSVRFKGNNNDLAIDYFKKANKIFKETGYDVTRMLHLDDNQKTLGEENLSSEGEGTIRKVGRFYEDFVFKQLMAAPDVAFSAAHFADSANISSTKIAEEQEGLKGDAAKKRAAAIFKDATSLDPKTDEGKLVRAQAIADASYATYQNESYYSTLALTIRKVLNTATGDLRMGDQLMPFVKTPANVIGAGIDAAGVSAIRGMFNLKGALESASLGNRDPLKQVVRDFVRSGLGLALAVALSALFDPDDFIGEYPISAKEQELLRLQRATPNSVRIGGKWISLDYFGAIAAPLVGLLYARKYGKGIADGTYQYGKGVVVQSAKIPGFSTLYDILKGFKEAVPTASGQTAGEKAKETFSGAATSLTDYISARAIPAITYDLGKAVDNVERKYDPNSPKERLQAKLPIVREALPVRKDAFGDEVKTEGAISTFLFGARVKTVNENKVITELERLQSTGNLPSITDVEKTSTRVKNFHDQMEKKGNIAKYDKAVDKFKSDFSRKMNSLISSGAYKRADDDKKATMINSLKEDTLDTTLDLYGYRAPKKKK